MPPKKKAKRQDDHLPDEFWCIVCGKLEEKRFTPRVRLVNRDPGTFGQFRVGVSAITRPHIPPARHQASDVIIKDADGKNVTANGNHYVGYCCNASFQRLSSSAYHAKRGSTKADDSAITSSAPETRRHVQNQLAVQEAALRQDFSRQQKELMDKAAEIQTSLSSAEAALQLAQQFAAQQHRALVGKCIEADAIRLEAEAKVSQQHELLVTALQKADALSLRVQECEAATASAERERDTQAALRRAQQARFAQQRTMDDRVITGIDTLPKVYAALGLKYHEDGKEVTGVGTSFQKKLADLSERRLRLLAEKAWLPVKTVLDAIHHDTAGVLRLLLGRAETEDSTAIQKEIMVSALADLPIVKDVVAELNHATDKAEETRLLSILTQTFSQHQLNEDLGLQKSISRRKFGNAKAHARMYGAGTTKPALLSKVTRQRVNPANFEHALHWICDPSNMQDVACGEKNISLSDGTELRVSKALRKVLRARMWHEYEAANMDPATGKLSASALKRSQFFELAKTATGGQQKMLTGLDNIAQRYGNENFDDLCKLVNSVHDQAPHLLRNHRDNILRRIGVYQAFLKREFVKHLQPASRCAAHCLTRLLGGWSMDEAKSCPDCKQTAIAGKCKASCRKTSCTACHDVQARGKCQACLDRAVYCSDCQEPCGDHSEHCPQCDEFYGIFAELHSMIELASGVSPEEIAIAKDSSGSLDLFRSSLHEAGQAVQPADHGGVASVPEAACTARLHLLNDFRHLARRYMARTEKYIGHLIRAHVEEDLKRLRREGLGKDDYILVIDWKMKFLAMVWMETQQEFFGKAGIPWHGGMAVMKYVPPEEEELESVDLDDFTIVFFDFITDSKKEDGFAVLSMVEGMVTLMRDMYPERTKMGIESDGAGCYSGKFTRLSFPLLSELTGIQVMFHSTGEAQCNKSSLDGHFGVAGPSVAAVVASGKQNCTTAREVVIAHKKSHAILNTVVREVVVDRSHEGRLDSAKAMANIPVRSIAFSTMHYDAEGKLSAVRFFKHAGFGEGMLVTSEQLQPMWSEKQQTTRAVLIDWPLTSDGEPLPAGVRTVLGGMHECETRLQPEQAADTSSPVDADQPPPSAGDAQHVGQAVGHRIAGQKSKKLKAAKNAAKTLKALENKRAKVEAAEHSLAERQKRSNGYWCKPPCRHFAFTKEMMMRHQSDPAKCPDVSTNNYGWKRHDKVIRPRYTGTDLIKKIVADPKGGVKSFIKDTIGEKAADVLGHEESPSTHDSDSDDALDDFRSKQHGSSDDLGLYSFIAATQQSDLQLPSLPSGFAMKPGGVKKPRGATAKKRAKFDHDQLGFLRWAYGRGVKNKSDKLGPAQAQHLMPLLGTKEGEKTFPNDAYWKASSCIDPLTGQPKALFRPSQLLDHWSFRPWFSQQKAAFDKKVAAQAKLAEQATTSALDPISDDEENIDEDM
eukprot:scaffold103069_cov34-Prasinocladus_malaysianus.AAC.2